MLSFHFYIILWKTVEIIIFASLNGLVAVQLRIQELAIIYLLDFFTDKFAHVFVRCGFFSLFASKQHIS